jgi:hypothetical protein
VRKVVQVRLKSRGKLGGLEVERKLKVEEVVVVREPYLCHLVGRSSFETGGEASCCAKVHELVAEEESVVVEALVLEAEIAVKIVSSN